MVASLRRERWRDGRWRWVARDKGRFVSKFVARELRREKFTPKRIKRVYPSPGLLEPVPEPEVELYEYTVFKKYEHEMRVTLEADPDKTEDEMKEEARRRIGKAMEDLKLGDTWGSPKYGDVKPMSIREAPAGSVAGRVEVWMRGHAYRHGGDYIQEKRGLRWVNVVWDPVKKRKFTKLEDFLR